MKNKISYLAIIVMMIVCCMKPVNALQPDSTQYAAFTKGISTVANWKLSPEKTTYFTSRKLFDIINGGAEEYAKFGLIDGTSYSLVGLNAVSAEVYLEDMGTVKNVAGLLSAKKKNAAEPKNIAGIKAQGGFYDEVIGGCIVYAGLGKFYVEMTLTGYKDLAIAVEDAKVFMGRISAEARKK